MSKLTGTFCEEWEFKCEPPNTCQIKNLKLSGQSIDVDELKEWREEFDINCYNNHISKSMNEIIGDIIHKVRTPTPPLPNLNDPVICQEQFELKNEEYQLYYNPLVIKWWRILEEELYEKLKLNREEQYWDLNIDYI